MPLYDYACQSCGRTTEILQRFEDPPLAICPHCGGEMKKLLSAPAFHLKGSGWYKTDYARSGGASGGSRSSGEGGASESRGESRGESKGEGKGESSGAKPEKSESTPSKGGDAPAASSTPKSGSGD